jgi:hypothetical protein
MQNEECRMQISDFKMQNAKCKMKNRTQSLSLDGRRLSKNPLGTLSHHLG